MYLTALPRCPLKMLLYRLPQSTMIVRDDELNAFNTPILEPTEGIIPRGGILGITNLHTEDFPITIGTDTRHGQDGTGNDALILIPALGKKRIDDEKRI